MPATTRCQRRNSCRPCTLRRLRRDTPNPMPAFSQTGRWIRNSRPITRSRTCATLFSNIPLLSRNRRVDQVTTSGQQAAGIGAPRFVIVATATAANLDEGPAGFPLSLAVVSAVRCWLDRLHLWESILFGREKSWDTANDRFHLWHAQIGDHLVEGPGLFHD